MTPTLKGLLTALRFPKARLRRLRSERVVCNYCRKRSKAVVPFGTHLMEKSGGLAVVRDSPTEDQKTLGYLRCCFCGCCSGIFEERKNAGNRPEGTQKV